MSQEPLAATHLPLSRWGISRRQLEGRIRRRRWADRIIRGLMVASVVVVLIPLFSLLIYVGRSGIQGLDLAFFTQLPKPVGMPGGGMANAIVGSLILVGLAAAIGVPVGVMAGVFLARSTSRLADGVRFVAQVLNGVPSIVVGFGRLRAHGGPHADLLGLGRRGGPGPDHDPPGHPQYGRDGPSRAPGPERGGPGLGSARMAGHPPGGGPHRAPRDPDGHHAGPGAGGGGDGALALHRAEQRLLAPGPEQPIASLPVTIYNYAISPYPEWHQKAWTGALVLVAMVLITNVLARFFGRSRYDRR